MNVMKTVMSAVVVVAAVLPSAAFAYPNGARFGDDSVERSTTGCGGCHGRAASAATTVAFEGPSTIEAGQTGEYTLTVTNTTSLGAGAVIASDAGTLTAGEGLVSESGALVHSAPHPGVAGVTTFTFTLTAPAQAGTITLTAAGNAVNLAEGSRGDFWNLGTLAVTVTSNGQTPTEPTEPQPEPTEPTTPTPPTNPEGPETTTEPVEETTTSSDSSGCSTTGGALSLVAAGLSAVALRRRRR